MLRITTCKTMKYNIQVYKGDDDDTYKIGLYLDG